MKRPARFILAALAAVLCFGAAAPLQDVLAGDMPAGDVSAKP
ncbi:MAG TPA: hypothetical protein VN325_22785 [Steroidobacteraceae bacterium]|nr:hypothetical protein [Steroidobacteraceae bacterium]